MPGQQQKCQGRQVPATVALGVMQQGSVLGLYNATTETVYMPLYQVPLTRGDYDFYTKEMDNTLLPSSVATRFLGGGELVPTGLL